MLNGPCALTGRIGNSRPHQLLLPGPATLGVHIHSDGAEAQQQLLAGNLHGAEGVQVLLGDEGQGVVLMVEEVDRGHVTVDAVEVRGKNRVKFGSFIHSRRSACTVFGSAPVASEAGLISNVEPLAEQTHPLNGPRGLQLSQATVPSFTLIHLDETE